MEQGMDQVYKINPIPKPRMTQRDKWGKRPVTQRYFAFKDEINILRVRVPASGGHVLFRIKMPKSWTKKKKSEMVGKPHQQTPDVDNYLKALLDAVYADDSGVWDIRVTKVWAEEGSIEITEAKEE